MNRQEAREKIRDAAGMQRQRNNIKLANIMNRKGRRSGLNPLPKLNEAVCIVRRNKLVDNEVLIAAGFNPYKDN